MDFGYGLVHVAERQPTNTAAPVPTDALRDALHAIRRLEADNADLRRRIEALEGLADLPAIFDRAIEPTGPGEALSAALKVRTLLDGYAR